MDRGVAGEGAAGRREPQEGLVNEQTKGSSETRGPPVEVGVSPAAVKAQREQNEVAADANELEVGV